MRQGYICWSLAVCGSLCSLVPVTGIEPSADVPFELVQQHLIVAKGSIAGLHGLNLLIDTGTIPSVLDQRIAKKLQLRACTVRGGGVRSNRAGQQRLGQRTPDRVVPTR